MDDDGHPLDDLPVAVEATEDDLQRGLINVLSSEQAEGMFAMPESQADDEVTTLGLSGPAHAMTVLARDQYRAGIAESPLGSNGGVPHSRYVRWFGNIPPSPWCAFFVSWCLDQVTDRNRRLPWANPGYVPSIHQWARGNGRLVSRPQHGDVFGSGGTHIGIVAGSNPEKRTLFSVEGNYSDRVACITRLWSGLWFARI